MIIAGRRGIVAQCPHQEEEEEEEKEAGPGGGWGFRLQRCQVYNSCPLAPGGEWG